jgi:GMP synthase (glutamine-hydrolysing)
MKKFLLVNNGTSYLAGLKDLLFATDYTVVSYDELAKIHIDDFDVLMLSGGHVLPLVGNESKFQREMDIIKDSGKPILGICFGFELIASAFGLKLELMGEKENGIIDITVDQKDELFSGIDDFKVFESHRWIVKETNRELQALAHSKDGIEVIKHAALPIYGVQFHPEMFLEKTCGSQIFHNFLKIVEA